MGSIHLTMYNAYILYKVCHRNKNNKRLLKIASGCGGGLVSVEM